MREETTMKNQDEIVEVQSFISCVSFPTTIEEMLDLAENNDLFSVEKVLLGDKYDYLEWTVPRWAREGDVVLFYHAKTGNVRLSNLRKQLKEDDYYDEDQKRLITTWIEKANRIFKEYGGRILAVGRLTTDPYYLSSSEFDNPGVVHYNMNMWAKIEDVFIFHNMIHINRVSSFVNITRQASVTPLFGEAYVQLKEAIWEESDIPVYYAESESVAMPLYKINSNNWLEINLKYGRKYRFESQFRSFYVDYFLRWISDENVFYRECPCLTEAAVHPAYVDNVILIDGKYLPVEVKLNVNNEKDLVGQVKKYCDLSKLYLNSNSNELAPINLVIKPFVLIFDVNAIYLYDNRKGKNCKIFQLDNIRSEDNLTEVRSYLVEKINEF